MDTNKPREYPQSLQKLDIRRKADEVLRQRQAQATRALVPVQKSLSKVSGEECYLPDWLGRVNEKKAVSPTRLHSSTHNSSGGSKSPYLSAKRPLPAPMRLPAPVAAEPELPILQPPPSPPQRVDGVASCASSCMCWTHTPSGWHSPWLWCALPTRDEAEGLCSRRCPGLLPPLRNLEEVALRNWDAALRQWDSALLRWDAFYSEWRGSRPHEDASRDESSTAHLLIWAAAPAIETQTEVETAPVAHPVVVPSAPLPLTIEASLEEEPPGREEINRALEMLGYPLGGKLAQTVHRYMVYERANSASRLTKGLADAIEEARKDRISRRSLALSARDANAPTADDEVADLLPEASSPSKVERSDRVLPRPAPLRKSATMPAMPSGPSPDRLAMLSGPKKARPSPNAPLKAQANAPKADSPANARPKADSPANARPKADSPANARPKADELVREPAASVSPSKSSRPPPPKAEHYLPEWITMAPAAAPAAPSKGARSSSAR